MGYNEKVEKLLPNDEDVKMVTEQQELEATWHMPLMEQSKRTHALERELQMSYMANGLCHQHHQMKRWCNTLKIVFNGKETMRPMLVKNDNCHLVGECWKMHKMVYPC